MAVDYNTAVANLNSAPLDAATKAAALKSLNNAYGVGTPVGPNYGASAPTATAPKPVAPAASQPNTPAPAPSGGNTTVPYDQALAGLNSGGLKGNDLAMAKASLANAYGVGTPTGPNYGASAPAPQMGSNGALAGQVAGAMTGPIPSNALGSPYTSNGVLGQYQSMFDTYQKNQDALLAASTPTAEEMTARDEIRQTNTKLAQGIAKIGSQAIPTPLIGLQSEKLNTEIASVIKPLQDEVDSLVAARGVQVDALTRVLQASGESIQMFANIQKLTMPNVLGTQVNPNTGDVYAITQGPDGSISTNAVGNVGATAAAKSYTQSGIYQAGDGSEYFYGITPDGKIVNSQLQGAGGSPSQYGPGGGSSTVNAGLTPAKLNSGAAKAGVSVSQFKTMPADVQNFYANAPQANITAVNDVLAKVANGQTSPAQAKTWVASLGVPQTMKDYLNGKIGGTTATSASSGGFDILGFLGGAAKTVANTGLSAVGIPFQF